MIELGKHYVIYNDELAFWCWREEADEKVKKYGFELLGIANCEEKANEMLGTIAAL